MYDFFLKKLFEILYRVRRLYITKPWIAIKTKKNATTIVIINLKWSLKKRGIELIRRGNAF